MSDDPMEPLRKDKEFMSAMGENGWTATKVDLWHGVAVWRHENGTKIKGEYALRYWETNKKTPPPF
jgi:hypothetical protein